MMPVLATKQPKPVGFEFDNGKHSAELEQDWNVNVTDTAVAVWLSFIRKVYAVLSIQLAITTVFLFAAAFIPAYKEFLLQNRWLSMVCRILSLVMLLPLHVMKDQHPTNLFLLSEWSMVCSILSLVMLLPLHVMKDQHPTNLYLLGGWTLSLSLMVSASTVFVPPAIICQAFFLTFAVVTGLTIYAFTSKKDFTFLQGGLFSALWILLLVGFLRLFVPFGPAAHLVYASVGALLFVGFLLYDTSNLIRKYSVDDWIPAVITLYLDILNLFLHILQMLSQRRD